MRGLLLIADGMGFSKKLEHNAITPQTMPFFFERFEKYGAAILEASGEAVGLNADETGNSEIGHLTIGAGRRLSATLTAIRAAYGDGSWDRHPLWPKITKNKTVHLVGLASKAGVHGHYLTLVFAAELAIARGAKQVFVHAIIDGVDSPAKSAPTILEELEAALAHTNGALIASVIGRKLACDRSGKLELAEACVKALSSEAPAYTTAALQQHLETKGNESSFDCHRVHNTPAIEEGATVLLTNHRADRTAQLARAFTERHDVYAMVELGDVVPKDRIFFPTKALDRGLIHELARHQIQTIRIAESCKFPHVTTFIDGFAPHTNAKHINIASIPEAQIRERPEMCLEHVVAAILESSNDDAVIIANLANLDQVGHLGDHALATRAARLVDDALETLHTACADRGWPLLFTSDHGNADVMTSGSHSMNPVPMLALGKNKTVINTSKGSLANVAPTFLSMIGAPVPKWMDASFLE